VDVRVLKKTIWPHQVKLKANSDYDGYEYFDPRVRWLEEKIPEDRWYVIAPNRFAFKMQEDATMFLLRWS
jgi:hypothetical protein